MLISGQTERFSVRGLIAKALLFVLSVFVLFHSTLFASQKPGPKTVLVLASYNPTSPVGFLWNQGIQSALKSQKSFPVDINIEHLDLTRFNDYRYVQRLIDLYSYKYSKNKPDLIIPIYNGALGFVLKYGQDIFPEVPIAFAGVERKFVESHTLRPNITGLLSVNSYGKTLDLAFNLQPDTRHVAVVSGAGIIGGRWGQNAWKAFRPYEGRADFVDLRGLPMQAILDKVSRLPAQTVVMYVTLLEDGVGEKFTAPEALSQISRVTSAPVYSFWDLMLGHGMVGGYLSSAEEKGKAVAELGLRILDGEKPVNIPLARESGLQYMFDWRELKRWSIPEDGLPPGSIVKFKELTLWDEHKIQILGAAGLIVLQGLIISYLLHQRRIRRRFKERLLRQELKYRTVADYTYDWECWETSDGKLRYVSPSCERITGYAAQDFKDNPGLLREIIVPEDRKTWDDHHHSDPQERSKSRAIQFRIQKPDGEVRWIEHVCQPIPDIQGEGLGVRASNRDITGRKKQEVEILERLEFEEFMARFSTELINVSSDQLDPKIQEVLSRIRAFMDVDRSYLFQFNRKKTEFRISHLWEAEYVPVDQVVRGVLLKGYFPWLAENLFTGNDVVIHDVEELSLHEAQKEYEYCRNVGIQSFLILPIQVEGAPLCAIGVDVIRTKREWSEEIRSRLRLIGENFGNAIARKHAELTLLKAYNHIESLKDRLEAESIYLQQEIKQEHNFENIIGQSKALKYVLYRVEQVSLTDSPVIVLGETGVGKELVARAIHKLSPRSKRALVKVNCAALPVNLVESELFGHEKGAFTGATMRQLGRFELASGSTLFLDEIGEMPMETQAKLLRVLESGEFERVGNPKTLHSDARIVASTNRDLEKAVREGMFRQDLWYRLKVFPITVPPLRERTEDISLLVTWFSEQLSRKLGKSGGVEISEHAMQALQAYRWPGNVRELKHMIEVALITAHGKKLKLEFPETSQMEINIIKPLEEMERDYILQVLKTKGWKIGGVDGVASALGMHPNTLRSRIKKLGIKKNP